MKKLLSILTILLTFSVLFSCKSDSKDEPKNTSDPTQLYGTWSFTYEYTKIGIQFDTSENSYTDIVTIYPNGTLTHNDGYSSSTNTYTVSGNKLTETIDGEANVMYWKIANGMLYIYLSGGGIEMGNIYTKLN